MTRETKVGLLIGVGVILLIGIVLSDHLSQVQQQEPAQLADFAPRAQDGLGGERDLTRRGVPTDARGREQGRSDGGRFSETRAVPLPDELSPGGREGSEPTVIDRDSDTQSDREWVRAFSLTEQAVPGREENNRSEPILPGDGRAGANTPVELPEPSETLREARGPGISSQENPGRRGITLRNTEPIVHYVKKNETLYEIAQRYYGNGEYYRSIIEANPGRVQANGNVRAGVRLVIPNKAGMANRNGAESSGEQTTPQRTVAANVIVVQSGETLSSIAQRYLGSSGRWRELFEANQHQISAPDQIAPGMELQLPLTRREQPKPDKAVYVVRSGDTLSVIASRVFGDRSRWDDIYQANRDVLDDPDSLTVGAELTLPARD